jgi:hypothetical protein
MQHQCREKSHAEESDFGRGYRYRRCRSSDGSGSFTRFTTGGGDDGSGQLSQPDTAPVHDALAVCAIIDPSVISTEFIPVDVETKGELTDGRTVCDFGFRGGQEPNVHFAVDVDVHRFKEMLFTILGRTT